VSDAECAALVELHARLAALPNKYADRLEGAYIDRAALRRRRDDVPALYSLAFGELVSKQRAVAWAVSVLPGPWRRLVETSVAARADPAPGPATMPDVLRFVEWAAMEGDEEAATREAGRNAKRID
jgi:hypothetical protein